MESITQFFRVIVASSRSSTENIQFDATDYIHDGLNMSDEDGLIKSLSFRLVEGAYNAPRIKIGMIVHFEGGDTKQNKPLFRGIVSSVSPVFEDSGEMFLDITCMGNEGGKLANLERDLVYPSDNHPATWGKKSITFSDIIINIARDKGIIVNNENINVRTDKTATSKTPVRQHNMTDWRFIQVLSKEINCTAWVSSRGGQDFLFLKDNFSLVSNLGSSTLFFPLKSIGSNFVLEDYASKPNAHQMFGVTINLDMGKGSITKKTNPKTGKDEIVAEGMTNSNSTGDSMIDEGTDYWVLDSDKVRGLSKEAQNELLTNLMDGNYSWDGSNGGTAVSQYFKLRSTSDSSRDPQANNIEVEIMGDNLKSNGLSTTDSTTENTGSKTYRTVIDKDKLSKLSSEERSAVMGRIARGELTQADKSLYSVVDTTPKPDVTDSTEKPQETKVESSDTSKTKKVKEHSLKNSTTKRDAGFKIECSVYGTFDFETKKSYVLEGLSVYSGTYYLYRNVMSWGSNGWECKLTFVK